MRRRLGLPLGTSPAASWLWVADPAPRRPDPVLLWRQRRAAPALGTEGSVGFGSAANVGFGDVPRVHVSGWSGRWWRPVLVFFLKKSLPSVFGALDNVFDECPTKNTRRLPLNDLPSVVCRVFLQLCRVPCIR